MVQQNRGYTWHQSRLPNGRFGPNVFKGEGFSPGFGDSFGNMAARAEELWRPGMQLSGEVINHLPKYLQTLAPFLEKGGKLKK